MVLFSDYFFNPAYFSGHRVSVHAHCRGYVVVAHLIEPHHYYGFLLSAKGRYYSVHLLYCFTFLILGINEGVELFKTFMLVATLLSDCRKTGIDCHPIDPWLSDDSPRKDFMPRHIFMMASWRRSSNSIAELA